MMRTKNSVMRDVERSYNKLIAFQKREVTKDDNGIEEVSDWITEITVYASVKSLFGKEYYEAKQVNKQETIKFIIRYIPNISENMRILFDGKFYNIDYIENIRYENRLLEIKAIEVNDD